MKKFSRRSMVFVTLSAIACAVAVDCTPAVTSGIQTGLTDIEAGCAAAELADSVIPPGTLPAQVAPDVALACDIADAAIPDIVAIIQSFQQTRAVDAGGVVVIPTMVYKPALWAAPKIASKRLARSHAAH